ncbi:MAG: metalloregulator ArsR/SmtB family transcription factor [Actinomycetota bacterium]|nr:metalloregulator ArsR/SmtB family transcription factor [Actinomycetota bacterium]
MAIRTLEAGEAAATAKLFRGLADPTRLRILLALVDGEQRVVDLVNALGTTVQSNVSAHLACLRDCGLVASRPQGRQVFYRLARPELFELLRAAERLLAATAEQFQLCRNYQER